MAERYEHLTIARTEATNERRRGRGWRPKAPTNPKAHAKRLIKELREHTAPPTGEVPGFDTRRLLKLTVEGLQVDALAAIPGMAVVSQEAKNVTVLFATEKGLFDFQRRLRLIAAGRAAKRKDILYAVQHFDYVTPEDRTGPALRAEGPPATAMFWVDVELWPLEFARDRDAMLTTFRTDCARRTVRILDSVNNASVVLVRVEVDVGGLDHLLRMRDVRQVDLPPRYQFGFDLLKVDVADLAAIPKPPEGAPGVVVLDAGLATGHPIIAPAVGESSGFTDREEATAEGLSHGTLVGSLALYGDLERHVEARAFQPAVHLFAGRVWDEGADAPEQFLENRIAEAVTYFRGTYGCSVYVLAFGDSRKPYRGGHVDRLAATLDTIAREEAVLFVVSAGNFLGTDTVPKDWRAEYPDYLLRDEARIIDPAPALNVLTVGSLARYEVSRQSERYPWDPAHQPVARTDEPSPFTRSGPGPLKAIKPELVEYGGNRYVDIRAGIATLSAGRELGEVGADSAFAGGSLLGRGVGTSFAVPKVAHAAVRILADYPDASPNLLRALLVAHAEVPEAARTRLGNDDDKLRRLVGYGKPREELSRASSERCVTMFAEERIGPNEHHFYELPLPEDLFTKPMRRRRRVTVSLAHCPGVRSTRLEYKECALGFRVVRARSAGEVAKAYRRLHVNEEEPSLPEKKFSPSPLFRGGGTVQCATHYHEVVTKALREKPYFVVVTNSAPAWATQPGEEPYALVVVIEDLSDIEVHLYSQIRDILRVRVRPRTRA